MIMIKENKPLQEQQNLVARAIREVSGFASMYHRFRRNLSVLGRSARTFEGRGHEFNPHQQLTLEINHLGCMQAAYFYEISFFFVKYLLYFDCFCYICR